MAIAIVMLRLTKIIVLVTGTMVSQVVTTMMKKMTIMRT